MNSCDGDFSSESQFPVSAQSVTPDGSNGGSSGDGYFSFQDPTAEGTDMMENDYSGGLSLQSGISNMQNNHSDTLSSQQLPTAASNVRCVGGDRVGGGGDARSMVTVRTLEGPGVSQSQQSLSLSTSHHPNSEPSTPSSSWKEELKEQAVLDMQSVMEQMESVTKLLLDHVHGYIDSIAEVQASWSAIQEAEHAEADLLEQTEKDVEEHVQFYHQA